MWTPTLITALNAVICAREDAFLFVKWANLPNPFEKRPLRIANSDNLPETVTGWEYICSRHFSAISQNLTSSIILLLMLIYIFCLLSMYKLKMTDAEQQRRTKELSM